MKRTVYIIILALALLLSGCGRAVLLPQVPVDPYAGMVQVESGYGMKMWVKKYDDVPVNPLRELALADSAEIVDENGVRYALRTGVDVSEHQGEIDWAQAADTGLEFAILRAGYRGYGEEGKLLQDACFPDNMNGAIENGIDIGVYFFSQATSVEEAEAEAEFLIDLLRPYDPEMFALPVFFDWENIDFEDARTDGVTDETLTNCAIAFCERLRAAGYDAGVYAYRYLAYYSYDLPRIAEYPLWISAVGERPDFYYSFDIWQFSTEGEVSGIDAAVDVDVIFAPMEDAPEPENTEITCIELNLN